MNKWIDNFFRSGELAGLLVGALRVTVTVTLVLLLGLLAAWILGRSTRLLLRKLGIETLLERVELPKFLYKIGIKSSFSDLCGRIVFWVVLAISALLAIDVAGIEALNELLPIFVSYLPSVIIAFVILIASLWGAQLASGIAERILARNEAIESPKIVSKIVYATIILIGFLTALEQLNIDVELAHRIVTIGAAAVAFGAALSLALGSRQIVSKLISRYYAQRFIRPGDQIEIKNEFAGRVVQFGPVVALIETEKGLISIPCDQLVSKQVLIERKTKSDSKEETS